MMGIQGAGMPDMTQMREMMQQMQSFKSGETNFSKSDLSSIQEDMASKGIDTSDMDEIISSFDEIDTDGNGISVDEMDSFTQSTGISFGPGSPPPGMFGGEGGPPQGGPPPGGPPPMNMMQGQEDSQSYMDTILESFFSSDSSEEDNTTVSYAV